MVAGFGHLTAAVSLGEHHHAAAVLLELTHVAIHAPGGGRAEGARGIAFGRLQPGVVHEVLRHAFAALEALANLRMGDVARDDEGAGDSRVVTGQRPSADGSGPSAGSSMDDLLAQVALFGFRWYWAGSVSSCSRKTPSLVILPRAWRSAEHDTAMPTGQEAPWRGSRMARTS